MSRSTGSPRGREAIAARAKPTKTSDKPCVRGRVCQPLCWARRRRPRACRSNQSLRFGGINNTGSGSTAKKFMGLPRIVPNPPDSTPLCDSHDETAREVSERQVPGRACARDSSSSAR